MKVDLKTLIVLIFGAVAGWYLLGFIIPNFIGAIIGAALLAMLLK